MTQPTPNADQAAFLTGFHKFLLDPDEKIYKLSGAGGTGKTFSMTKVVNEVFPKYLEACEMLDIPPIFDEVVLTATTNKAAEALAEETGLPTQTIHSLLSLKVVPLRGSRETKLMLKRDADFVKNKLIVVDEASMLCPDGLQFLHDRTINCKILFVGDKNQLLPINSSYSPVYKSKGPESLLTISERNKTAPALMALCQQLRDTIEDLESGRDPILCFRDILLTPGQVDYYDQVQMFDYLDREFSMPIGANPEEHRVVAFRNQTIRNYNDHVRYLRKMPVTFVPGEILINNRVVEHPNFSIKTDTSVMIHSAGPAYEKELPFGCIVEMQDVVISAVGSQVRWSLAAPTDGEHLEACIKYIGKMCAEDRNFDPYHAVKALYPDLRQRDALTSHKAQGSSFDTVLVDLSDLSTCHQPKTFARLLYVAVSRARHRVIFYGNLAPKYGKLIERIP